MGGDMCADFLKGACHRPGCRYSHADPNGRARGDGAPAHRGNSGSGRARPSEAKGFGGFEGGSGWRRSSCSSTTRRAARARGRRKPTPGDWLCGRCDSLNFKKRDDCNRCRASRSHRAMDITPANVDEYVRRRERQAARQRRRAERRDRNGGVSASRRVDNPGTGTAEVGAGTRTRGGTGTGIGIGTGTKTTSANAFPVVILLLLLLH